MFKKILLIIVLILISLGTSSCSSIIRYTDGDITYEKTRYHEINEPFCYYVEGEIKEVGRIYNIIFPATHIFMSLTNDNVLFSPASSVFIDSRFDYAYVKDGFNFPDNDTVISEMYFGDFKNKTRFNLDIPNKSFNETFIKTTKPRLLSHYDEKDIDYLYIVYDNLDLNQKIIKYIDSLEEDEYGDLYFKTVEYINDEEVITWYELPDYLKYQFRKINS